MKNRKTIIILCAILGLFSIGKFLFDKYFDRKDNLWEVTYANNDTRPYGTYISYDLIKDIFDKGNVKMTRRSIPHNLKDSLENYFYYDYDDDYISYNRYYDYDDYDEEDFEEEDFSNKYDHITLTDTTSYVFINDRFQADDRDVKYLLDFVGIGNNVFISAETFSFRLMDTLGLKAVDRTDREDSIYTMIDYPQKKYIIKSLSYGTKLTVDSTFRLPSRVLAQSSKNDTVFMQIQYGKGSFYLHTVPTSFVNVNVLDLDKYDFPFRSLSYLPRSNKIIWDEYQTQGPIDSVFSEVSDKAPLRAAVLIILVGLLLFMIFRAKRIQRAIPIVKAPNNSSLEFLDTISNLYYEKRDFTALIKKRHAYFLDFIRKNYYLTTENINQEFIKSLSAKSTVDENDIKQIFDLYQDVDQDNVHISNDAFLRYNNLLERFYKVAKNK